MAHDDIVAAWELKAFMSALRIKSSGKPISLKYTDLNDMRMHGEVEFWFIGGAEPRLCASDIIRGYGMQFVEFQPRFQDFKFDKAEQALIVNDDQSGYRFSLQPVGCID